METQSMNIRAQLLFLRSSGIVVLALLAATVARAETPQANPSDEWHSSLQQAIAFHSRAVEGEEDIAKKAMKLLKELVKSKPRNPIALAYLGSSYALMGRDASRVTNKVRYTNRGLRYMDQALALTPEDFTVLMVSAQSDLHIPKMFKRSKKLHANALLLDRIYAADPTPEKASPMVVIYDYLYDHADDADDAKAAQVWKKKKQAAQQLTSDE